MLTRMLTRFARRAWPLLLVLSLGACGGSDDEGTPAPSGPSATSAGSGGAVTAEYSCSLPDFESKVMQLVNAARAEARACGTNSFPAAPPLTWNDHLHAAAAAHAADMARNDYFSHDSLDGTTFSQRITGTGYAWNAAGENIAAGQASVEQVVQAWLDSPGHCANIMSDAFTEVGVACVAEPGSTYKQYWGMSLARPR